MVIILSHNNLCEWLDVSLTSSQRMLHKLVTGPARSADISPNGELIGVGLKNGGFVLINMSGFTLWGQKRDRATAINVIRSVNKMAPFLETTVIWTTVSRMYGWLCSVDIMWTPQWYRHRCHRYWNTFVGIDTLVALPICWYQIIK